jgi:uncharacterized protein YecE (DUF72 family)
MTPMLPLFDEPPSFRRDALAAKLEALARKQIYIGTSSWKYEGWCGQIYTRERYAVRGKFARKRFEADCIAEYAETFPIVCGDFAFYQFPTEQYWRRLFTTSGPELRFAFKVPEEITVREFPSHPRYGPKAGTQNPSYLNADLFRANFTDLLAPYQPRVPVLIFEFGTFGKRIYEDAAQFVKELDPFLARLPSGFGYAVEIRNADYLAPEYFACLRHHGVAHTFNAWTRMPELHRQMRIQDAWTADFIVTRALLRFGRPYEQAVERFSPYERIQDENPDARRAIREMIRTAREQNRRAYIFVNNRLEGNAPQTIEAILEDD